MNSRSDIRSDIQGGSISAIRKVKGLYSITENTKPALSLSDVTLIDVQFLGQRSADDMINSLENPPQNSLFLPKDHNMSMKPIVSKKRSNTSRRSLNALENITLGGCVSEDLSSLAIGRSNYEDISYSLTPDSLYGYIDNDEIYCGSVMKLSRHPVFSVYKVANIDLQPVSVGNKVISKDNKKNYMITDRDGSNYVLIANPSSAGLKHKASYKVSETSNEFSLKKISNLKTELEAYRKESISTVLNIDMIIKMVKKLFE